MLLLASDLALHKPIRLSRAGPGASDSVIYSGVASGDALLHGYAVGTAEVTRQARIDTARGLVGVKVVDPVAHQEWRRARELGRDYDEPIKGTVIEADWDPETDQVFFRSAIHAKDAIAKIDAGEWPDVSVAYEADLAASDREDADVAQLNRRVRHLALCPEGRDTRAHIVRDMVGADSLSRSGAPMATLAELKVKHPDAYKRARKALTITTAAGVPIADAVSLDKAIPILKALKEDEFGRLLLHAIANEAEEVREIEAGSEDVMDEDTMPMPMADELKRANDALTARVEALEKRNATADAQHADALLKDQARTIGAAYQTAGLTLPEGLDLAKPTAAALADAQASLVKTLSTRAANPRRWNDETPAHAHTRRQFSGTGARLDGADAANPKTFTADEL